MTDPFAAVAEHYDIMIDWPARLEAERPLFAWLLAQGRVRRVLDIGCGTGHHARLLAEMGMEVLGIDPSQPMIARAQQLTTGGNPAFLLGDFHALATLPAPFDLVTVLGNTLPYVRDEADLRQTARAIHDILAPGGLFYANTINYDSLLAAGGQSRWLPLVNRQVEGREYLFLREFNAEPDHVDFTLITLICDGEWRQLAGRSRHFPITGALLIDALQGAGFRDIHLYGDDQRGPYDPLGSPFMTAVASRAKSPGS